MKMSIGTAWFASAVLGAAAPAAANPPVVVEGSAAPTAQVGYSDLNLASRSGIAILQGRIRRAAQSLCETPGVRPLGERLDGRQCVIAAIASAQGQVQQVLAEYGTERFAGLGTIAVRRSD